ncbi:hypothetical protein [Mesorhizobium sp.]|uniref:hypothetical protein n=1 Tax=Mesorhizobium sp. TaxID=1871066 RepID=UPI000FE6ACD7|nr:hypothetical protein [Mesorhizobium sp.]RWF20532.1 MAG: hypothetical protein EOS44_30365 [Mesorhizobium sp.]
MENSGGGLVLVIIGLGGWFAFGDPPSTVAGWWWPETSAPWETVDAFFYPDRNNLYLVQEQDGLKSLQACRDWVSAAAYANGDPTMSRSDYECGLGKSEPYGTLKLYRNTVR